MPVHFRAILNALENELQPFIKKLNLTKPEFEVLHVLANIDTAREKGVAQKFVTSLSGMSDYQITRLMMSLENKGFISKLKSKESKREKLIVLTQLGIQTINEIPQTYSEACQKVFCSLSDEDTRQIQRLLLKIRGAAVL